MSWHSLDMELNGVKQAEINRIYHRSPKADLEIPTEDQQILLETKFTTFQAVPNDPRVGISQSASETND